MDRDMDPWSHPRFHTDNFGDLLNRMREAAVNRRLTKQGLTDDIKIKELGISFSSDTAPEKHFRRKRTPGKLVSAEFFYEEDDEAGKDFSGPTWPWNE